MTTTIARIYEALTNSQANEARLWLNARGQVTASGDTTIIAAPGVGNRLVLAQFTIQNTTVFSTTVIVKHGATAVSDLIFDFKGDGLRDNYVLEVRLPENTALVLNLSGANAHNWSARYFVEAV